MMDMRIISTKPHPGLYFEDFVLEETIVHATPRTVTVGDVAFYTGLYGPRFPIQSSDHFARACGLPRAPIDDWLTFHLVFGKTVPDISLNAVANLGYAGGRFYQRLYPGDTVTATSKVVGLKENSDRETGVVWVHTKGLNQDGEMILEFIRWVLVRKRSPDTPTRFTTIPELPTAVAPKDLKVPKGLDLSAYDTGLSGSPDLWDDYEIGECMDHMTGGTVEESEHMMAARLYQNTAAVHFDQHAATGSRFGQRLAYGGHVISLIRSLTFNGLANACFIAGLNAGRHIAPCLAGDTIYAWSRILDKRPLPRRKDAGALRVQTVATKNFTCEALPYRNNDDSYHPAVILDLDYWVIMPRRR